MTQSSATLHEVSKTRRDDFHVTSVCGRLAGLGADVRRSSQSYPRTTNIPDKLKCIQLSIYSPPVQKNATSLAQWPSPVSTKSRLSRSSEFPYTRVRKIPGSAETFHQVEGPLHSFCRKPLAPLASLPSPTEPTFLPLPSPHNQDHSAHLYSLTTRIPESEIAPLDAASCKIPSSTIRLVVSTFYLVVSYIS